MKIFAAILLALASSAAGAQSMSLLKGGPAEYFDDADRKLFLDNLYQALDEAPDKEARAWQNPANGHRGDVTVLRRFESKGRECKEVRVRNEAQTRKSDMRYYVCSVDGKWRLVGKSQL